MRCGLPTLLAIVINSLAHLGATQTTMHAVRVQQCFYRLVAKTYRAACDTHTAGAGAGSRRDGRAERHRRIAVTDATALGLRGLGAKLQDVPLLSTTCYTTNRLGIFLACL